MKNECDYKGTHYILVHNNWMDEYGVAVLSGKEQQELYDYLLKEAGANYLPYHQLNTEFEEAVSRENDDLADRIGKVIIERAECAKEYCQIRWFLPRMTSFYRHKHRPQLAVEYAEDYINGYNTLIKSSALFVSLAAAYLDMCDITKSKECVKMAQECEKNKLGEFSIELTNVIKRLRRVEDHHAD